MEECCELQVPDVTELYLKYTQYGVVEKDSDVNCMLRPGAHCPSLQCMSMCVLAFPFQPASRSGGSFLVLSSLPCFYIFTQFHAYVYV